MSNQETKKPETKTQTEPKKAPKVTTKIKAGPNRRAHDHIGNFNA